MAHRRDERTLVAEGGAEERGCLVVDAVERPVQQRVAVGQPLQGEGGQARERAGVGGREEGGACSQGGPES